MYIGTTKLLDLSFKLQHSTVFRYLVNKNALKFKWNIKVNNSLIFLSNQTITWHNCYFLINKIRKSRSGDHRYLGLNFLYKISNALIFTLALFMLPTHKIRNNMLKFHWNQMHTFWILLWKHLLYPKVSVIVQKCLFVKISNTFCWMVTLAFDGISELPRYAPKHLHVLTKWKTLQKLE